MDPFIVDLDGCETFEVILDVLSKPFIDQGVLDTAYNQAILDNLKTNGPYFVLAPRIALVHANANQFVTKVAISFGFKSTPIDVGGQPVSIFIYLASPDASQHMEGLMKLMPLMDTTDKQEALVKGPYEQFKTLIKTTFL